MPVFAAAILLLFECENDLVVLLLLSPFFRAMVEGEVRGREEASSPPRPLPRISPVCISGAES
jgi:hypothetical protein